MKHLVIPFVLVLLTSCGILKQQNFTYVTDVDKQKAVLYQYYPKLWEYYKDGVLDLRWIKEYTKEDGSVEYTERHSTKINYVTDYSERMSLLKDNFPEIYHLFTIGKVTLNEMYKYVGNDGNVKIHISYRNL